jgi:hypothetical protein
MAYAEIAVVFILIVQEWKVYIFCHHWRSSSLLPPRGNCVMQYKMAEMLNKENLIDAVTSLLSFTVDLFDLGTLIYG